jgi:tight adherence protein B
MGLIIGLTFVGAFAAVALVLSALNANSAKASRQAVATLDAVIKADKPDVRKPTFDIRKREELSSIPWLNNKLRDLELVPYLRRVLEQAKVEWSISKLLAVSGLGFVIPFSILYLRFNILVPGILAGIVPGLLPLGWVLLKRRRRFDKFEEGLPEALDLMVSGLRAGHSLNAAMGLVGRECPDPVGGEFKVCFEEQNYGLEIKTALDNMLARVPLQDLSMVSTAIIIQKESGGNLAEVLDKTSYLIRERFRLKRQVKTHTAQGRLTGWILTFVPVGLGIAMYFINPEMMSILWHRDIGIKLMWAAVGMILLGGYVIQRIVDIDV